MRIFNCALDVDCRRTINCFHQEDFGVAVDVDERIDVHSIRVRSSFVRRMYFEWNRARCTSLPVNKNKRAIRTHTPLWNISHSPHLK